MKKQPLKVGFDLDGVILYNPVRIMRPFVAIIKNIFSKKKDLKFYYPKSKLEKLLWSLGHKSSIFVAPGLDEIKELVKEGKIAAYIITARYDFLKKDFQNWINKMDAQKYFKGIFHNANDEQPHLFKEKMVKKLDLDIFVEDNWDIVRHLSENTKKKIFWIYNIFDKKIIYKDKLPHLKKVIDEIKTKYL